MTWGLNEGPREDIKIGYEVIVVYTVTVAGKVEDREDRGVLTDLRVAWLRLDRGVGERTYRITSPRDPVRPPRPNEAQEIRLAPTIPTTV